MAAPSIGQNAEKLQYTTRIPILNCLHYFCILFSPTQKVQGGCFLARSRTK